MSDKPLTDREEELVDKMNEYYDGGAELEIVNRLERLIGISESTREELGMNPKELRPIIHLLLLACVRIGRLQDEKKCLEQ